MMMTFKIKFLDVLLFPDITSIESYMAKLLFYHLQAHHGLQIRINNRLFYFSFRWKST